jgi:molybdopterin molybdotransferase
VAGKLLLVRFSAANAGKARETRAAADARSPAARQYRHRHRSEGGSTPITPQQAEEAILSHLSVLSAQSRPLEACIGQTLRQDVFPERDNPPFDRVCMDGIAVATEAYSRGARQFRIESMQPAGAPAVRLADSANAVEVMTGAIVPTGADCVIPLEEYDLDAGVARLKAQATAKAYRNIQRRGEDSAPGVAMLSSGIRLGAPEIAVAASAGLARLHVTRQPRIVAISTGDELVEPGQPILEHQVRRSNAYAIVAALRDRGYEHVANDHIRDHEQSLTEHLSRHLSEQDVLIMSGGVSKGRFDLVPKVLEKLAVREIFHQVAQRPGMPMYFGSGPEGQAIFGLPGNPVSTLICLVRYVVTALIFMSGRSIPPLQYVPLASAARSGKAAATYFLPVALQLDVHGTPAAMPAPTNGPGDFLALTRTQGFLELPPQTEPFAQGFAAPFYRW